MNNKDLDTMYFSFVYHESQQMSALNSAACQPSAKHYVCVVESDCM